MKHLLTALTLVLVLSPSAQAATNILNGFQLGSTADWPSCTGSPVIDTTAARSETYGMHISSLTSATFKGCRKNLRMMGATTGSTYKGRCYIFFVSFPGAAGSGICGFAQLSTNTYFLRAQINSNGTVDLLEEDGTTVGTSAALSTGQWYRIEIGFTNGADTTTANDTAELLIDGVSVVAVSNLDFDTSGSAWVVGGNFGLEANTGGEWYIDDIKVNDASGTQENTWPGPGGIVALYVNGDGDAAACTPTCRGMQGTDWQTQTVTGQAASIQLDEQPTANDNTDYIDYLVASTGINNRIQLFTVTDLSANGIDANDTINLVAVVGRAGPNASDTTNQIWQVRSGASTVETLQTRGGTGYSWGVNDNEILNQNTWGAAIAYVDPATTVDWTLAGVDAAIMGFRSTDVSTAVRFTFVYMLVEFVSVPNSDGSSGNGSLLGLTR